MSQADQDRLAALREEERSIVKQLKAMEETVPNGRDYERRDEFIAAYDRWQEERNGLEAQRRKAVDEFRAIRRNAQ